MMRSLFHGTIQPDFLVFLRIGTAALVACALVSVWPDFMWLFAPDGLVDPDLLLLEKAYGAFSIHTLGTANFLPLLGIVYFGLCTLLGLGFLTRLSSIALLLLHGCIFTAVPQFSYGFDYFCTIALFYCSVFPVGRYCSLDRYVFHRRPGVALLLPCLRVLQLHLCLVYFFSGLDKLLGHTWRNGAALWKAVHLPYFNQGYFSIFDASAAYPIFWVVGGWAIILLELCYPVFIWSPLTRKFWLGAILLLHAGIAVILSLPLFSGVMVLFNMSAFFFHPPFQAVPYTIPYPSVAAPKLRSLRWW